MLATTIENDQIAVSIFRTENLARKWIQEMREMHHQAFGAVGQGR